MALRYKRTVTFSLTRNN